MIINPFKCESCGRELQPDDIGVGTNEDNELIKQCGFCGCEVVVK